MPKNRPSAARVNEVVGDILAQDDEFRPAAAVAAAGQRLTAYTDAEVQAAEDQLRADRVGFDSGKVNALRRR